MASANIPSSAGTIASPQLFVAVRDHLRVAVGPEGVARLEPGAQLLEVVDLAVEHHLDEAVLAAQRLVGGGAQVDDGEAAVHEADRGRAGVVLTNAFRVRAAMAERRPHAVENGFPDRRAIEVDDAGQAAHESSGGRPRAALAAEQSRQKPKIWWRWPSMTKPMLGGDLVLDALDLRAGELEDLAARLADEMVVVLPLVFALEARLALQDELLGQPRRLQELERAVDGGAADVGAALLHELEEVVHGEVALGAQEGVEDHFALLAALQAVLDQIGGENLLFLAADVGFHGKGRLAPVRSACQRQPSAGRGESVPRTALRGAFFDSGGVWL